MRKRQGQQSQELAKTPRHEENQKAACTPHEHEHTQPSSIAMPLDTGQLPVHWFQTVTTCGSGACAIHSVFGTASPQGMFCANARNFLANQLGATAACLRTHLNDDILLQELEEFLWKDVVKPQAKAQVGLGLGNIAVDTESRMLWAEVQRRPGLLQKCLHKVVQEEQHYSELQQKRREVSTAFACLCTRLLEHSFLRPLLASLGILETYMGTPCDVHACPHVHTKYDALFEPCPEGRLFRQSIVEYCGVQNFHVLLEKVQDVVGTMDLIDAGGPVVDFLRGTGCSKRQRHATGRVQHVLLRNLSVLFGRSAEERVLSQCVGPAVVMPTHENQCSHCAPRPGSAHASFSQAMVIRCSGCTHYLYIASAHSQ